jgi:hypothetical protein
MAHNFQFHRIPLQQATRWPIFHRTEYPPRVVYEFNLGVGILTVIDHSKMKSASVPAGYTSVDSSNDVVRAGDLVLDGLSGIWRHAADHDLGVKVEKRLGVARKSTAD